MPKTPRRLKMTETHLGREIGQLSVRIGRLTADIEQGVGDTGRAGREKAVAEGRRSEMIKHLTKVRNLLADAGDVVPEVIYA